MNSTSSPTGRPFRRGGQGDGDIASPGGTRMGGMGRSIEGSNLDEAAEAQQPDILGNEQPNVYFAYTEDGGAVRAENPSKNKASLRGKSAQRPGTAPRKGRTGKRKEREKDKDKDGVRDQLFGNLPQNPFMEDESKAEKSAFP